MKSEHRVLSPESVEFVYELGGLGTRMMAVLVDHLLIAAALLLLWIGACLGGANLILIGPFLSAAMVGAFLIYFGFFAWFEWKWNGQTPGKRLMDLRVIDERGINIDLFQAVLRNLFRVVDMMPSLFALDYLALGFYGVGGTAALMSPRNKRLGDWAAGTLVVRTRKRVMPEAIITPADKYNSILDDGAVRTLIRSRLSLDERETLLQLCLRRHELEYEARHRLFREAAEHLEQRLELPREPFLSEEKYVQNITAAVVTGGEASVRGPADRPQGREEATPGRPR
jgi:uncharacterized RDD family membrane protein YckC